VSEGNDPGPYIPPLGIPQWPEDDQRHRIQLVFEVPSGPGVEIVAAELLLDVVQSFTRQGLAPACLALRISCGPRPER
jgi:hypothetical protein